MTSSEIALVRTAYAQIVPIGDQASALFYARLFELDPTLRGLFQGDMAAQGRQLMLTLGFCVANLDRLDLITPVVRELGLRQVGLRVRESHYETVGQALLWTLEKALGTACSAEMRAAWAKAYWLLAENMKAGARDGAAQQSRVA